jgi:hypothetical protein
LIFRFLLINNSPLVRLIAPRTFGAKIIVLSAEALAMTKRREPGPSSLLFSTRGSGSMPRTVNTIPLGLGSERTLKPGLLMVEKLPLSELLVMMAKVSPTFGLKPLMRLTFSVPPTIAWPLTAN